MSVPTSDVDICNLALSRLGQAAITSVAVPTTSSADICARHYDETRRELLRAYVLNFSRKRAVWTSEPSYVPAFGLATAYRLPNDFIRFLASGSIDALAGDTPGFLYDFEDGYFLCDSGDAVAGGINVQYVFDAKNVTKYDPLFVRAFRLQLAADMAYAFTLKPALVKSLEDELKDARAALAAVAGQEKPPRRVQRSRIRDVRRSGGIFRDNTRI